MPKLMSCQITNYKNLRCYTFISLHALTKLLIIINLTKYLRVSWAYTAILNEKIHNAIKTQNRSYSHHAYVYISVCHLALWSRSSRGVFICLYYAAAAASAPSCPKFHVWHGQTNIMRSKYIISQTDIYQTSSCHI